MPYAKPGADARRRHHRKQPFPSHPWGPARQPHLQVAAVDGEGGAGFEVLQLLLHHNHRPASMPTRRQFTTAAANIKPGLMFCAAHQHQDGRHVATGQYPPHKPARDQGPARSSSSGKSSLRQTVLANASRSLAVPMVHALAEGRRRTHAHHHHTRTVRRVPHLQPLDDLLLLRALLLRHLEQRLHRGEAVFMQKGWCSLCVCTCTCAC